MPQTPSDGSAEAFGPDPSRGHPCPMIVLRLRDGAMLSANRAAQAALGCGLGAAETLAPALEAARAGRAKADLAGPDGQAIRFWIGPPAAADGAEAVVLLTAAPPGDGGSDDAALLAAACRAARVGGWSYDVARDAVRWSAETRALFEAEDAPPRTRADLARFIPVAERARHGALVEACLTRGERYDAEFEFITGSGAALTIRGVGEPMREGDRIVGARGAVQDVTALKTVERMLEQSKARFRALADALPIIVWSTDAEMEVVEVNAMLRRYLGEDRADLPWTESVHPDDVAASVALIDAARRSGRPFESQHRLRRADGAWRWHRFTGSPYRDATGAVAQWFGCAIDIHDLRQAEEVALDYAGRLNRTLESISDGLFAIDRDWRFTFVNAKAESLTGRSRHSLVGRRIWDEFPEAVGTPFEANYRAAMAEGRVIAFETYFPPLDTWFAVTVYPQRDGLAIYFQDATARRRALEGLRLLGRAIEGVDDALLLAEIDAAGGGMRVIYANAAMQRLGRVDVGDWLEGPASLLAPGASAQRRDELLRAFDAGEPFRAEVEGRARDGAAIWLDLEVAPVPEEDGVARHCAVVMRDVTRRREYDARLSRYARRMTATVSALQRLATLDFRAPGMLDAVAALAAELTGADEACISTLDGTRLIRVAATPGARALTGLAHVDPEAGVFLEAIRSDRPAVCADCAADPRPDCAQMAASGFRSLIATPLAGLARGQGVLKVMRRDPHAPEPIDLDGLKLFAEAAGATLSRMQAEAQLRAAQRMEAIGQLTGGVAHDFNNLLTVILGNAEMLVESLSDDAQLRLLAEMTQTAAQRGAELTQRLLAFARRQPLDPAAVDVNGLLGSMDALLRRTLGDEVEVELVRGGGLWRALVDAPQLENALLNLCLNARDAMPDGGRLTIETANAALDDAYAREAEEVEPGQYVMIAVSDTGVGMTEEVRARAFDPFFTTKAVGRGSGLGLSMVFGFVKQSRGHVRLYSEPGQGTTVRLYLPRAAAEPPAVASAVPEGLPRGAEAVLLVEDDTQVREHAARLLESLGYRVLAAPDGPSALALLREGKAVDLLFTDVVMPGGMNGRELADAARALRPGLPVLFTSGYTENAIVHHGRLDRGVLLLAKPYRRGELAAKLRQALDGMERS
jgi:PAS domain S-box-containing protein